MKKSLAPVLLLLLLVVVGFQVTASDAPEAPAVAAEEATTPEAEADDAPPAVEAPEIDLEALFGPAAHPQSCSCTDDDDCAALCFDGGECMAGECACYTSTPGCPDPGPGGSGNNGSCDTCTSNDDCISCGPEYVCAWWGECVAV